MVTRERVFNAIKVVSNFTQSTANTLHELLAELDQIGYWNLAHPAASKIAAPTRAQFHAAGWTDKQIADYGCAIDDSVPVMPPAPETFTDDYGAVWSRPTAEQYYKIVMELRIHLIANQLDTARADGLTDFTVKVD